MPTRRVPCVTLSARGFLGSAASSVRPARLPRVRPAGRRIPKRARDATRHCLWSEAMVLAGPVGVGVLPVRSPRSGDAVRLYGNGVLGLIDDYVSVVARRLTRLATFLCSPAPNLSSASREFELRAASWTRLRSLRSLLAAVTFTGSQDSRAAARAVQVQTTTAGGG